MQSMKDADFLRKVGDEGKIKKAVVIGGGLIGIETCEALQLAGIEITVIELLPQLLTFLDWELAKAGGKPCEEQRGECHHRQRHRRVSRRERETDGGQASERDGTAPASWRSWPSASVPT